MEKHLAEMKKDVEANEEKDREREKQRVRESKLQKKIKEKAQNVIEEAPMVLLGSEEEDEQSMEEEFSVGLNKHTVNPHPYRVTLLMPTSQTDGKSKLGGRDFASFSAFTASRTTRV